MTDRDAVQKVVDALVAKWGQIDILVNNAGITQPLKIMEIGAKNYDAVLDVNLRGTLYCSQAVIPHMRERMQGKIVNMSSVSAQRGGGILVALIILLQKLVFSVLQRPWRANWRLQMCV